MGQIAQPFGEREQPGKARDGKRGADRGRAHVLDPADIGMVGRGHMVGELLKRRVEQLDRKQQQDHADQREAFPGERREQERERDAERERDQFLAKRGFGFCGGENAVP